RHVDRRPGGVDGHPRLLGMSRVVSESRADGVSSYPEPTPSAFFRVAINRPWLTASLGRGRSAPSLAVVRMRSGIRSSAYGQAQLSRRELRHLIYLGWLNHRAAQAVQAAADLAEVVASHVGAGGVALVDLEADEPTSAGHEAGKAVVHEQGVAEVASDDRD